MQKKHLSQVVTQQKQVQPVTAQRLLRDKSFVYTSADKTNIRARFEALGMKFKE